jgi:chromosome segregation ATPase
MKTEKDCLSRLKTFENISQKKIDSLNQRLNAMKTQIQNLNEYISSNYQTQPQNENVFQFKEMENQIATFLSNERNENIEIINQNFATITNNYLNNLNNPNEKEQYFDELNSLQNQINEIFKEIVNKADTAKSEREHTQISIIDGINAEFNKIYNLVRLLLYLCNKHTYF